MSHLQLHASDFAVGSEDIYEHDKLNRKAEVENLKRLLLHTKPPFVMAIDSPWGSGKTSFIKLLEASLGEEDNIKTVYHNSWEADFSDDPLIPLLSELNDIVGTEDSSQEKWTKAKKLMGGIAKRAIPAALKIATYGALDLDATQERAIGEATAGLGDDLLCHYESLKTSIKEFKESLNGLAGSDKTIIYFIDELDRCRPNYSIQLLERIKHLFSVENIIFVLAVDCKQLQSSIQSVYGAIDAKQYLKRFFYLEYCLREPKTKDFIRLQLERSGLANICKERELRHPNMKTRHKKDEVQEFIDAFELVERIFPLSLRDLEQRISRLTLIVLSHPSFANSSVSGDPNLMAISLLVYLAVIHEKDAKLFKQIISKDISIDDLLKGIKNKLPEEIRLTPALGRLEGLLYGFYCEVDSQTRKDYDHMINKVREDHLSERYRSIVSTSYHEWMYSYDKTLEIIIGCIELSGKFKLGPQDPSDFGE